MPIIKIRQPSGYAQIANSTLRDKRLKLDTRGFLCELLSHTEDLDVSIEWLMEHFEVGRDKLFRMTKELKACGYLETPAIQDEKGQFLGKEWFIYGLSTEIRENLQTVMRETRTAGNPDDSLKREDQEEKREQKTFLRNGPGSNSPERLESRRKLFWSEFVEVLTSDGITDIPQAKKLAGKLCQQYDRDLVAAVYEENRLLITEASEPFPYIKAILEQEKNKSPGDREAERQLREAKRYHRGLYQNLEYTPPFEAKTYLGRWPLIERFIGTEMEKSK